LLTERFAGGFWQGGEQRRIEYAGCDGTDADAIAGAKLNEIAETDEDYDSPIIPSPPTRFGIPEGYFMDGEIAREILACNDRDDVRKLLSKLKEKSMMEKMKYDPKFATSPIFITDKNYEFSVDPELITLVESDPFHGYESETAVAHLTKLNDIVTLFTHKKKNSLLLILKLFPFSLKGDAKI
jgi:hypothetical protein